MGMAAGRSLQAQRRGNTRELHVRGVHYREEVSHERNHIWEADGQDSN